PVKLCISSWVERSDGSGARSDAEVWRGSESAIAIGKNNADGPVVRIGHGEVRNAISIEIADGRRAWVSSGRDGGMAGKTEITMTIAQHNRNTCAVEIGDH